MGPQSQRIAELYVSGATIQTYWRQSFEDEPQIHGGKREWQDAPGKATLLHLLGASARPTEHVPSRRTMSGGAELMRQIQGTLVAFNYANVFREYHKQVTGKEPMVMQSGLTICSHHRMHGAGTRRLSPTIYFADVYLALALDEMDTEPRPETIDENVKRIPLTPPEFQNEMHHYRLSTRRRSWTVNTFPLPLRRSSGKITCNAK